MKTDGAAAKAASLSRLKRFLRFDCDTKWFLVSAGIKVESIVYDRPATYAKWDRCVRYRLNKIKRRLVRQIINRAVYAAQRRMEKMRTADKPAFLAIEDDILRLHAARLVAARMPYQCYEGIVERAAQRNISPALTKKLNAAAERPFKRLIKDEFDVLVAFYPQLLRKTKKEIRKWLKDHGQYAPEVNALEQRYFVLGISKTKSQSESKESGPPYRHFMKFEFPAWG